MTQGLAELVGAARCLLVDFDGPICAGYFATSAAADLRDLIHDRHDGEVPSGIADIAADPLLILR